MNDFRLEAILRWIISGGAGVALAYLIEHYNLFANLKPEPKRLACYAFIALVAWAAWGGLLASGLDPMPTTWLAWVDGFITTAATAILASGIVHGRLSLSRKS